MIYFTVIQPSGISETQELERLPSYPVLSDALGGPLEVVPYFSVYLGRYCVAFCNEEGKLNELDYNLRATLHWSAVLGVPMHDMEDHLVGPIVLLSAGHPNELKGL